MFSWVLRPPPGETADLRRGQESTHHLLKGSLATDHRKFEFLDFDFFGLFLLTLSLTRLLLEGSIF